MMLSFLLQEASYFIKLTFAVGRWCHSLLWSETTLSLILKILVMAKAVSHSWWLPLDICPSLYQGLPKDHLTASCHNILNIWEIIQDRCMLFNISAYHYLRPSVLEWGKRHRIISINAVIIKFNNKSWAAYGSQMTYSWSSVEDQLEVIWQPKAAQDLLWNLMLKTFLQLILYLLPFSWREELTSG